MRWVTLPVGQAKVYQSESGVVLEVYIAGVVGAVLHLPMDRGAAGELADALEDACSEVPQPRTWGVYSRNNNGDGEDEPVLLNKYDTYQAAVQDVEIRRSRDERFHRFNRQYFYKQIEAESE